MLKSVLNLIGLGTTVDFKNLKNEGAIILDVRSKSEYTQGNIKGSINISVDQLHNNLNRLVDKNIPIITCCASGMRSSQRNIKIQWICQCLQWWKLDEPKKQVQHLMPKEILKIQLT